MKILVTGGAGYLGSVMVPRLLDAGHEVAVLDNFMYNQTPLLDICHNPKLTIVRGDARDKKIVEKLVKESDALFPLACLTGAPLCAKDPIAAQTILVDAIKMAVDFSSKSQPVIFPTTNSGYGVGEKGKFCTEETPLRPISVYGRLKCDAEKIVLDSGHGITLRLATAFGASPRMRLDLLVNDFVYRAVYDRFVILFEAHFKRNFIHTRDVAKAFIHSLNNFEKMKNEPYNVGLSDANLSKKELCEEIKKQIPDFYFVEAAVGEDPDKRDYIVSNDKIEKTGFKPDMSLSSGIRELVKTYQILKRNQYANV
ncbi:MAG: NAD(P)-dependent oxidoreductase [Candidatus Omnitrophica bacterium]|nr:NAD(P)-dependent oxidoreductase [Candidatus Omnitrophota bacterium]